MPDMDKRLFLRYLPNMMYVFHRLPQHVGVSLDKPALIRYVDGL